RAILYRNRGALLVIDIPGFRSASQDLFLSQPGHRQHIFVGENHLAARPLDGESYMQIIYQGTEARFTSPQRLQVSGTRTEVGDRLAIRAEDLGLSLLQRAMLEEVVPIQGSNDLLSIP